MDFPYQADPLEFPIDFKRKLPRNFKNMEDYTALRRTYLAESKLYTDPSFPESPGEGKIWMRATQICHTPKFIDGEPTRFDALQGELDNDWLIVVMETLTAKPDLFSFVVPSDQSFDFHSYFGAFHFRIWQLGEWLDVVVDDRIPVYAELKPHEKHYKRFYCYAHALNHGCVFWAALLEKAYVKVTAITGNVPSYNSLDLGDPFAAMQDLTGGIPDLLSLADLPKPRDHLLPEIYERRDLMCVITNDQKQLKFGLVPGIFYAVTRVYQDGGLKLISLMNPYGRQEWTGPWNDKDNYRWGQIERGEKIQRLKVGALRHRGTDGEFWMSWDDFVKHFENMYVCYLEPANFLETHNIPLESNKWYSLRVRGEWVKYFTAAGHDIKNRGANPQYLLRFGNPGNWKKKHQIVMSLTHRAKLRGQRTNVAFYIYDLRSISKFPIPSNMTENGKLIEPENPDADFRFSMGRTYNWHSNNLHEGKWVIIPFAESKDFESCFVLRIYSPLPIRILKTANIKRNKLVGELIIAKPLPSDGQSDLESNATPTRMFIDAVQDGNEMDWIGLKNVLEEAFNPNGSFFGMFVSFLEYIQAVFRLNILHLSDEYEKDKVIFTKDECRMMIAMLDEDHSGKLNISEFCSLWKTICFWSKVYDKYKDQQEGYLNVGQLKDALGAIGYDVPTRTLHSLSYVYSNEEGAICLTDFILCGVTLETTMSLIEKGDVNEEDEITFTLNEWVKKTLIL